MTAAFSPSLQKLISSLQILPGVGVRTAQRMAFHLLNETMRSPAVELAEQIKDTLKTTTSCIQCRNYSDTKICHICSDVKRAQDKICVVQSPLDLIAIENSQTFKGQYFVLRGYLSPIDRIGPEELGLDLLAQNIKKFNYQEIILATNATPEGQATAYYIQELAKNFQGKVSRIAFGVPLGGELEYLSDDTLKQALQDRKTLND